MRHPQLTEAVFTSPTVLEIRRLTFKLFPKDEAWEAAKYILGSVMDELDDVKEWLDEHDAGVLGVGGTGDINEQKREYSLTIEFYSPDDAFSFKLRWL